MANNAAQIDRSFVAFSHPIRRRIVERLASGPASVGEASAGIRVSKPTISRHLRVLEDAGVVRREVEGREHRLSLSARPFAHAGSWIERQRALWERKFDVVEDYLTEQKETQMTETGQTTQLRVERAYEEPPAEVFDAWTNPEVLRRWWAAGPDWETPTAEVDLREGGRYRLSMKDPSSGDEHTIVGEYREVSPPERLVYTWTWESNEDSMAGSAGSVVTVEFQERDGGTNVVVTHEGFADEQTSAMHVHGWEACLANLSARVLTPA